MRRFIGRKATVSILILSTMFIGSVAAATPAGAAIRGTPTERRMIYLINKARTNAHRHGLQYSPALSKIARKHSALMAKRETIFHTSNLAYELRRLTWRLAGENVGMGPSIDALHQAFMNSPPHRHNNLDSRFHRFGVGVVWRHGIAFITIEFMS